MQADGLVEMRSSLAVRPKRRSILTELDLSTHVHIQSVCLPSFSGAQVPNTTLPSPELRCSPDPNRPPPKLSRNFGHEMREIETQGSVVPASKRLIGRP
jgi:hypothetical protein